MHESFSFSHLSRKLITPVYYLTYSNTASSFFCHLCINFKNRKVFGADLPYKLLTWKKSNLRALLQSKTDEVSQRLFFFNLAE